MAARHKKSKKPMTHEAKSAVVEKEAGFNRGGGVKSAGVDVGSVAGGKSAPRLDKRARGGGVGADKSPLSSAAGKGGGSTKSPFSSAKGK